MGLRAKVAIGGCVTLFLLFSCLVWFAHSWLHQSVSVPQEQRQIEIRKGESLYSVSMRLQQQGLIRWPRIWRKYAHYFDPEPILSGEYLLAEAESPKSILDLLQSGKVVSYTVTLVEGWTFAQFLDALSSNKKLTHVLDGLTQAEQMAALGLTLAHPEGWFYPDTYQFIAGDRDADILQRAYQKMVSVLDTEWQERQEGLPYETPYQALIMASIIEKETGAGGEREQISGVFVRRLLKGMRLQTDPTVIYGLGNRYAGNITRKHLREETAYNTYRIHGLPPTPIAMPGRLSIHAALHPDEGSALYFVAKGDGSHHFSDSLKEHNQAVDKYQRRNRPKNYRSSPVNN